MNDLEKMVCKALNISEVCEKLKEYDKSRGSIIERLSKENEELKNDVWKDKEMKRLKEENERLKEDYYRGFPISKEEWAKVEKFKAAHAQETGVSGGGWKYIFIPTGIGTVAYIEAMNGDKLQFQELG